METKNKPGLTIAIKIRELYAYLGTKDSTLLYHTLPGDVFYSSSRRSLRYDNKGERAREGLGSVMGFKRSRRQFFRRGELRLFTKSRNC